MSTTTTNPQAEVDHWSIPVGGAGSGYVCCPAGTYMGTIVGIFDVGLQTEKNRETAGESQVRKLIVVFELTRLKPDGTPFILAEKYTFSMNEKANFYKLATTITGTKFRDGDQFSPRSINGLPVMISVGNTSAGDRSYHHVSAIAQFPEGLVVPTSTRVPIAWSVATGEEFPDGLDWVPKVYGKTVRTMADESAEARRRPVPAPRYQPVPGGGDSDIPF